MAAIVVGQYVVDATKCTEGHHTCVHDWRVTGRPGVPSAVRGRADEFFDNVAKTGDVNSNAS